MKIDQKLIMALLELLYEKKPVNKHSLCQRAGIHRYSLDYRIEKHVKEFQIIDAEIVL